MRKEMTFTLSNSGASALRGISFRNIGNNIANYVSCSWPLVKLAQLYSYLLDEKVSPRRALRILNASAALGMLVCSAGNALAMLLLLIWAALACYGCRKRG